MGLPENGSWRGFRFWREPWAKPPQVKQWLRSGVKCELQGVAPQAQRESPSQAAAAECLSPPSPAFSRKVARSLLSPRLFSHVGDPFLDDSLPREYVLYLRPTGPLAQKLSDFWQQSKQICGKNKAHNIFPHITLCQFFMVSHTPSPARTWCPEPSFLAGSGSQRCKSCVVQFQVIGSVQFPSSQTGCVCVCVCVCGGLSLSLGGGCPEDHGAKLP